MKYKVAVASKNGKSLEKNLRLAKQFIIYEVCDNDYLYLETRNLSYNVDEYYGVVLAVSDCHVVVAECIEHHEINLLNINGIFGVQLFDCSVDTAVKKVMAMGIQFNFFL